MATRGRPIGSIEPIPEDIAASLCEWLTTGRTLRDFCRQPGMPARSTIDSWRQQNEVFAGRVARARDLGFDAIADNCEAIADGTDAPDEDVQRSKLRVETRLKLLACWDPRRYGNKVQVGGDGGEPIRITDRGTATAEIAAILANAAQAIEKGER